MASSAEGQSRLELEGLEGLEALEARGCDAEVVVAGELELDSGM
jgi:hypothetical protein